LSTDRPRTTQHFEKLFFITFFQNIFVASDVHVVMV